MIAKLIPLDGKPPILISRDLTLVGRKRGLCDLILDHSSISKIHCVLAKTDGLLFFRDLGSTNGTRVNGQRVIRGALLPGDELAFANIKFRVHLGPADAPVRSDERTEMIPAAVDEDSAGSDEDSVAEIPLIPNESRELPASSSSVT